MLVTNNSTLDQEFRLLRQHGMSVPDLVRHQSSKIIFEKYLLTGFNFRMTDIQAAIGLEQLKKVDDIVRHRRELADIYKKELSNVRWLELPQEPKYAKTNWQSFAVRIRSNAPLSRNRLMEKLLTAGIASRSGIMNAHEEKPYRRKGFSLPYSEAARSEVVLLPLFHHLSKKEIVSICEVIKNAE